MHRWALAAAAAAVPTAAARNAFVRHECPCKVDIHSTCAGNRGRLHECLDQKAASGELSDACTGALLCKSELPDSCRNLGPLSMPCWVAQDFSAACRGTTFYRQWFAQPDVPAAPATPSDWTKLSHKSCEGRVQAKQLEHPTSLEDCQASVWADRDCGFAMFSAAYSVSATSWGCRCCVPGAAETDLGQHDLWDIYVPAGGAALKKPPGTPAPWEGDWRKLAHKSCEGHAQAKQVKADPSSLEDCQAAAWADRDCGFVMFSAAYSVSAPSWGCRCCTPGAGEADLGQHDHWDIYAPASDAALRKPPATPAPWEARWERVRFRSCPSASRKLAQPGSLGDCLASAAADARCGPAMFSAGYSVAAPSWGCRCCAAGTARGDLGEHDNWDIYLPSAPAAPAPAPAADGVSVQDLLARARGEWRAAEWGGGAAAGGDPDPIADEAVISVSSDGVAFPNGGGGGPYPAAALRALPQRDDAGRHDHRHRDRDGDDEDDRHDHRRRHHDGDDGDDKDDHRRRHHDGDDGDDKDDHRHRHHDGDDEDDRHDHRRRHRDGDDGDDGDDDDGRDGHRRDHRGGGHPRLGWVVSSPDGERIEFSLCPKGHSLRVRFGYGAGPEYPWVKYVPAGQPRAPAPDAAAQLGGLAAAAAGTRMAAHAYGVAAKGGRAATNTPVRHDCPCHADFARGLCATTRGMAKAECAAAVALGASAADMMSPECLGAVECRNELPRECWHEKSWACWVNFRFSDRCRANAFWQAWFARDEEPSAEGATAARYARLRPPLPSSSQLAAAVRRPAAAEPEEGAATPRGPLYTRFCRLAALLAAAATCCAVGCAAGACARRRRRAAASAAAVVAGKPVVTVPGAMLDKEPPLLVVPIAEAVKEGHPQPPADAPAMSPPSSDSRASVDGDNGSGSPYFPTEPQSMDINV